MTERPVLGRTVNAAHVPAGGLEVRIDTDEDQRRTIAKAYDLLAVNALAGTTTLTPSRRGSVIVEGRVTADIVQSCVVTLDPVPQQIDEAFSVRFVPADSAEAAPPKPGVEVVIDPAAPDPPEIMEGTNIDVGALVEEIFALAIDPYPRAPGAELPAGVAESVEKGGESPFAVLAKVRRDKG